MTRAETLLALAARCEAGTGHDRALDAEIARAVGSPFGPTYYGADGTSWGERASHFLTSLDAAATLVPAACDWLRYWCPIGREVVMRVSCATYGGLSDARTPARALTAAALRARAAEAGNGA